MESRYLLYTDGSCLAKTKQGGWGWILKRLYGNATEFVCSKAEGVEGATISRMEMSAIIDGILAYCGQNIKSPLYIISDSQFIVNAMTKGWFENWKLFGFVGRPNQDLWQMFDETLSLVDFPIRFIHTRGHEKGMEFHKQGNTEVDKICSYKNFFKENS